MVTSTGNLEMGVTRETAGVLVSGLDPTLDGKFLLLLGVFHQDRSIYSRIGGTSGGESNIRLWFHEGGGWMISDTVGSDMGWACCLDEATEPQDCKEVWSVWDGRGWERRPGMRVTALTDLEEGLHTLSAGGIGEEAFVPVAEVAGAGGGVESSDESLASSYLQVGADPRPGRKASGVSDRVSLEDDPVIGGLAAAGRPAAVGEANGVASEEEVNGSAAEAG